MEKQLLEIRKQALENIQNSKHEKDLEFWQIKYLGRKSELSLALKNLGKLKPEERAKIGKLVNDIKKEVEEALKAKKADFKNVGEEEKWLDKTIPGTKIDYGHLHPITLVYQEIFEIFGNLGFQIVEGPDIETDWYNFEALNLDKDHPARDTQDSFFISSEIVLRTHTSPVQIRTMQKQKPPIRIIVPGRTYRRDMDVTHTPMFHQLEGLLVDEEVTFTDLKGTLDYFVKAFFGASRKTRFRPHYFPFTEPSAEADVSCGICGGKGCRSCKYSGWLEILGAGMVHPNVLKNGGIDPKKYQGFAFGMGIERLAMLKYNIDDTRLFYENDLRFLEQF